MTHDSAWDCVSGKMSGRSSTVLGNANRVGGTWAAVELQRPSALGARLGGGAAHVYTRGGSEAGCDTASVGVSGCGEWGGYVIETQIRQGVRSLGVEVL